MANLKIFSTREQESFNTPPLLLESEWESILNETYDQLKIMRKNISKIGFLLQYGYFKMTHRFFPVKYFNDQDVNLLMELLAATRIDLSKYGKGTISAHRDLIFDLTGVKPFKTLEESIKAETQRLIRKHLRPREICLRLIEFVSIYNCEIPSLHRFSEIITYQFIQYEEGLLDKLSLSISEDEKVLLEDILNSDDALLINLPRLKSPNQSLRPGAIKGIVDTFMNIQDIFIGFIPLYKQLNLTKEAFNHYASWTLVADNYQLRRFSDKRKQWLYLLSFIHYQYVTRQDYLVDIFLQSVQHYQKSIDQIQLTSYSKNKEQHKQAFKDLLNEHQALQSSHKSIGKVLSKDSISDREKLTLIQQILDKNTPILNQKNLFEKDQELSYYQVLEKVYRKLNNRVGLILKVLKFNSKTSDASLIEAIEYYQKYKFIGKKAPFNFLPDQVKENHFDTKDKIIPSRYKTSLFIAVNQAIKSGKLNLIYSSKYLSIEEYLVDDDYWKNHKSKLIKQSGLGDFEDVNTILKDSLDLLDKQYTLTNDRILSDQNTHFSNDSKGKYFVQTPASDKENKGAIKEIITSEIKHKIPLAEVLLNAQMGADFLKEFKHLSLKASKKKPTQTDLIAIIIAYGCNIGLSQMRQTTKGVDNDQLQYISKWFLSVDNLLNANDLILSEITKLELSKWVIPDEDLLKTASDGQKMGVKKNNKSLNARYSYKYFGSGKGISVNSFIDDRNMIFHTNVLSSSDRESMYLIDGLVHQSVVKSKWHTTDTEGFTEVIFAVTNLMGIEYAPRIKKYKNQVLYSGSKADKEKYIEKGYLLLPHNQINTKLIKEQWGNILKFVSTIMLRDVTPSQLFKRLNSYSKQHPLYAALKEYGKIVKTRFILNYYDSLELRQAIEYRLNMAELTQKFSRAVFFAHNQEIEYETIEEQNIAMLCKQLLQNSIVLWNYMLLTKVIMETNNDQEKYDLLEIIKNGTVITWKHINFYGEYDFSNIDTLSKNIFDHESIQKFTLK